MSGGRTRGSEWAPFVAALVALDVAAVSLAFVLAHVVRFQFQWFAVEEQSARLRDYVLVCAVALPVWAGIFAVCGLYRRDLLLGGTQEYARLVQACTYGFGSVAVLSFLSTGSPAVSRGWLVATWPLAIATTGLARFGMRRAAYRLRHWRLFLTDAVMVGANAQAIAIARQVDNPVSSGVRVVGFLDDYLPAGSWVDGRWPVLGAPALLRALDVDEAIVVQHALTWESLHDLMRALAAGAPGPAIRLAPTFFDLLTAGMSVGQRGNVPVIALNRSRIAGLDAVLKTGFECVLGATLLALLGPFLLWKAARGTARGQALERRRYAGVRGQVVEVAAYPQAGPAGARLRRLLEKGPALVSVLRGDVALVGPRLIPMDRADGRTEQPALLSVKPGLTGPVSVAGPNLDPESALALELRYVRDYSIWSDLLIIWQRAKLLVAPAPGMKPRRATANRHTPGPGMDADPGRATARTETG